MIQTPIDSMIEQIVRTGITYIASVASYHFIFPESKTKRNLIVGLYFVVMSLVIGFIVRRIFNG